MRRIVLAALAAMTVPAPAPVRAYDLPYDPYPWCAVYNGEAGGASNCGFLTIEQCRATVSGKAGSASTINSTIRRGRLHGPAIAPRASRRFTRF
jgi:hypothetical protein